MEERSFSKDGATEDDSLFLRHRETCLFSWELPRGAGSREEEADAQGTVQRSRGAAGLGQACSVPPVAFWRGHRAHIVSPSKPARGAFPVTTAGSRLSDATLPVRTNNGEKIIGMEGEDF